MKIIKKNMYDLQYILAILTFVLAMLTQHKNLTHFRI